MGFHLFPKPMSGCVKVLIWVSVVTHLLVGPFFVYYGRLNHRSYAIILLNDIPIILYCLCRKKK